MTDENLKLVIACLLTLTLSIVFNMAVMKNRVVESVISELKRDYVPGPYNPGFDPDKVPPGSLTR